MQTSLTHSHPNLLPPLSSEAAFAPNLEPHLENSDASSAFAIDPDLYANKLTEHQHQTDAAVARLQHLIATNDVAALQLEYPAFEQYNPLSVQLGINQDTLLQHAIRNSATNHTTAASTQTLAFLISKSNLHELNICNKQGFTALHEAAWYGHANALHLLLAKGMRPNQKTHSKHEHFNDKTPLQIAIMGQATFLSSLKHKSPSPKHKQTRDSYKKAVKLIKTASTGQLKKLKNKDSLLRLGVAAGLIPGLLMMARTAYKNKQRKKARSKSKRNKAMEMLRRFYYPEHPDPFNINPYAMVSFAKEIEQRKQEQEQAKAKEEKDMVEKSIREAKEVQERLEQGSLRPM